MCRLGVNTATDSEFYEEDWRSPIGDDVSDFSTQLRVEFSLVFRSFQWTCGFLFLSVARPAPTAWRTKCLGKLCDKRRQFFFFLCGLWQKGETLDELNLHNCMLHQNLLASSKWLKSFVSIMSSAVHFHWLMECFGRRVGVVGCSVQFEPEWLTNQSILQQIILLSYQPPDKIENKALQMLTWLVDGKPYVHIFEVIKLVVGSIPVRKEGGRVD